MSAEGKEPESTAEAVKTKHTDQQFKHEVRQAGGTPSPGIDFNTFIISLGSSALSHIDGSVLPTGEKLEINLELAQQTIDLLDMLEHKTRGNLAREEEELLSTLLYDLRVRYVHALRGSHR